MTNKWNIDPSHSDIEFKVKHLMISTLTGKFTSYTASMENSQDDFSDAVISFSADINSINTGNEQRDGHLKSDDFFNAEKYPTLNFVSTSYIKGEDNTFKLIGNLSIREVSKEVELSGEFNGLMTDFYGNQKAGFELTGKINRKDFNLKWTATTEAGGIVVSDEVKLFCNIQMVKIA